MVAIRYRHNFANIVLTENEIISGNAISGRMIPALLKNGEYMFRLFGGVADSDSNYQKVKLVGITAFWWSESTITPTLEIPSDSYVGGFYHNDRFLIAIKNDLPIVWCKS